jgi:predicted RNA-binding Zn-ribbon protein involved in translation (DUF1610 family)
MEQRESAEKTQRTLGRGLEPSCFQGSRTAPKPPRTGNDLHVCPSCGSRLVYPATWTAAERNRWTVSLRCPECEWRGGGVYGQAALERFDEVLDRGIEEMIEDLKALARANMEEAIDRFVDALHEDHVLPEDF